MKTILLIIGVLAAGGSAYWAVDLKGQLEQEIAQKQGLHDQNVKASAELKASETKCAETQKLRDAAIVTQTEAKAALESETSKNVDLTEQLATAQQEADAIQKKLDKMLDGMDGRDPDELLAEVEKLKSDAEAKKARLQELAQLQETVIKQIAPKEADAVKLEQKVADYKKAMIRNGQEYAVTAIDPKWNFLIFSAGENSGLTPASAMIVMRNGKRIGMLKVTQIDKNQTIADIVPSSVKAGQTLQVGDKVIPLTPEA